MNTLINQIIKNKSQCFFISPHLDDAALSCGELMKFLSVKTDVTVINLFTSADTGKQTLSARKALTDSDFTDAEKFYMARVNEDRRAYSSIGVRVVNLGHKEALWRKIDKPSPIRKFLAGILPEALHVYPTYRLHIASGKVSENDYSLIDRLSDKLKKLISKDSVVFCPVGVGNHVDHLVTRLAVEKEFNPIYWLDQPYLIRSLGQAGLDGELEKAFDFPSKDISKKTLLAFYKTQMRLLFNGKNIPKLEEKFYVKKDSSSLPEKAGEYSLVREILKEKKSKHYTYGLYKNSAGEMAFAKQYSGSKKDLFYYWLLREIEVYQLIGKILNRTARAKNKPSNVFFPKFIKHIENEKGLLFLIEYIEGKLLVQFEDQKRFETYKKVFDFLEDFNNNISSAEKSSINVRFVRHWLFVLPFASFRVFIRYPNLWRIILTANFQILSNGAVLFSSKKLSFVHRDLGDWNIFVKNGPNISSGEQIFICDLQLSCFSNPELEYAVAALKNWKLKRGRIFFEKVIFPRLKNQNSIRMFRLLSICLALYDLSLNDGGNSQVAVDFLKFNLEMLDKELNQKSIYVTRERSLQNRILETINNLKLELKIFWETPKSYLYLLTLSTTDKVKLAPYDPQMEVTAQKIIRQIQKKYPGLKVHFTGSARLKVLGRNDIDLSIEAPAAEFNNYLPGLTELFGRPSKRRRLFLEWDLMIDESNIDLNMADPTEKSFQERMQVFDKLKKDKQLLNKYVELKKELNGLSVREYTHKRMKFFNEIIYN